MRSFVWNSFIVIIPVFILIACNPAKHLNRDNSKHGIMDSIQTSVPGKIISDPFMSTLLESHPQFFDSIISKKDELNVQIIYSQIDRKKNGKAKFTDHYFNYNPDKYFYP